MYDLLIFFWLGGLFSLLFVVAEILHLWLHIHAETTRKIVHIGSGLLALLFPYYFTALWQVAALCAVFFIVLLVSKRLGLLVSINGIRQKSLGSTLYPVIVFLTFAFYQHCQFLPAAHFSAPFYFAVPMMLMAICDPAAAFAGAMYKRGHPGSVTGKTMTGTMACFLTGLLVAGVLVYFFRKPTVTPVAAVLLVFALGLATAISERLSKNGWDNFTIPLCAAACIFLAELFLLR